MCLCPTLHRRQEPAWFDENAALLFSVKFKTFTLIYVASELFSLQMIVLSDLIRFMNGNYLAERSLYKSSWAWIRRDPKNISTISGKIKELRREYDDERRRTV